MKVDIFSNMSNKENLFSLERLLSLNFDFIEQMGFVQAAIVFRKLNSAAKFIPYLASVEIYWRNEKAKRQTKVHSYVDGDVFIYVHNLDDDTSFGLDDYFKSRQMGMATIHEQRGSHLAEKIENYIKLVKEEFSGSLNRVLLGGEWIDIQFDWGPYK